MYRKTLIACLLLLNSSICLSQDRYIKNRVQLDESEVVLHYLPSCIVPLNDSLLYFTNRGTTCYLSNYKTGKLVKKFDFSKIIDFKQLAGKYTNLDTEVLNYNVFQESLKSSGIKDVMIEAITRYDSTSILAVFDINLPNRNISGNDTTYSALKMPFYAIISQNDFKILALDKLNLRWKPEKMEFESPMYGFRIFESNIYVANVCMPGSKGRILSVFDKNTFSRKENAPQIYHKPYKLDTPSPSYFHFATVGNNSCYVSANNSIYSLSDSKPVLDLAKLVPGIKSIDFFSSIHGTDDKFLVFYTAQSNGQQLRRLAIVDILAKRITEEYEVPIGHSCLFGKNIISIEKQEDAYYYVVREI